MRGPLAWTVAIWQGQELIMLTGGMARAGYDRLLDRPTPNRQQAVPSSELGTSYRSVGLYPSVSGEKPLKG